MTNKTITVVDVRSSQEYAGGHVAGAINIPLNELPAKVDVLKSMEGTIILCCASGMRSSMARTLLIQNGITNVTDGGPWTSVNYQLNNQQ